MMPGRRDLLIACGAAICVPYLARAQAAKVHRIAILQAGTRELTDRLSVTPFKSGLAALGYAEGRNLVIDIRYAEGKLERLPDLAGELVATKPDLIYAPAAPATTAAQALTSTIPIVYCFVNDPVALGFAQSLARPGGNLAGLSNYSSAVAGKRVELLGEIVPRLARLAVWYNPDTVNDPIELREVESAVARLRAQVLELKVRSAADYEQAASASRKWNADAIYITSTPTNFTNRRQIIALVAGLKKAATYPTTVFVEDGGLMTYTVNFPDLSRRAATYADKILRGAKPADLPVEQPTKFELVINLRTANALGIKIPAALLQRSDSVIE